MIKANDLNIGQRVTAPSESGRGTVVRELLGKRSGSGLRRDEIMLTFVRIDPNDPEAKRIGAPFTVRVSPTREYDVAP